MTPVDESEFTPGARPGWTAWNSMSPECEIAALIGALVRAQRPNVIVETGVGAGYVTREILAAMPEGCELRCVESDPAWRAASAAFTTDAATDELTPGMLADAELVILDSASPGRLDELSLWSRHGAPGSLCFVHDAGNGHKPGTSHAAIGAAIRELELPGVWLANPRGAWLGQIPTQAR